MSNPPGLILILSSSDDSDSDETEEVLSFDSTSSQESSTVVRPGGFTVEGLRIIARLSFDLSDPVTFTSQTPIGRGPVRIRVTTTFGESDEILIFRTNNTITTKTLADEIQRVITDYPYYEEDETEDESNPNSRTLREEIQIADSIFPWRIDYDKNRDEWIIRIDYNEQQSAQRAEPALEVSTVITDLALQRARDAEPLVLELDFS